MTHRILAILGLSVAGLAILVVTGWGALVLFYLAPGSGTVRTALAWSFAAVGLVTVAALPCAGRAGSLSPSSPRPWDWCWSDGPA